MLSDSARAAPERRRQSNASAITWTIVALGCLGTALDFAVQRNATMTAAMLMANLLFVGCALLVRSGRVALGVGLMLGLILALHVVLVAVLGHLTAVPFFAGVVVLIAAATLPANLFRWAWVPAAIALGLEWSASSGGLETTPAAGLMVSGVLLLMFIHVISLLHVDATERAFRLALDREAELERAQQDARESAARYALLSQHTEDLIALLDPQGRLVDVNPSGARFFGGGRPFADWRPQAANGKDGAAISELLERAVREGTSAGAFGFGSVHEDQVAEVNLSRVASGDDVYVVLIARDVTQRLRATRQLEKGQRMEALGRLAGGVAHDFNNLLSVILSGAQLALEPLPEGHASRQDLDSVLAAAERARRLTGQLLDFSRKRYAPPTSIDACAVLDDLRPLLERLLGADVELAMSLAPDTPLVRLSATSLEQIALNLTVNAREAMPGGGKLRLSLGRTTVDGGDLPAGDYLELRAEDTGDGIPAEAMAHLFEPFFTTKSTGTGLGLATCYGIAQQAGGTVHATSAPGRGTTFVVWIPEAPLAPPVAASGRPLAQGSRVLVVDDDDPVRRVVCRILRDAGYETLEAGSAAQARTILERPGLGLVALVTDVVLGDERGPALFGPMRERFPEAVLVVISGYDPDTAQTAALVSAGARFVAKPFEPQALLAALRS